MRYLFFLNILFYVFAARAVILDPAKGKTSFLAVGRPSAIKINGKGQGPTGDLQLRKEEGQVLLTGEADMDLTTLDTGIGMRDRHMKEKYLEVEKYKHAVLKFKDVKIPTEILRAGGEIHVPALLALHGLEKPVDVTMTFKAEGANLTSSSRFKLKLTDYAIEIPKFSGVTVADEVEITTDTEVAKDKIKEAL